MGYNSGIHRRTGVMAGFSRTGFLFVAAALVFAACSRGDDVQDGASDVESSDTTAETIEASPLPDTSDGDGDGDGENSDGSSSDANPDGQGDEGREPDLGLGYALCGLDRVNKQDFYAVGEIADDDPDGGLNLRTDYEDGIRVSTLPEDTVLYVEDCAVAEDGGAWYSVQTLDGEFGWVNSSFLTTEISPLVPTSGGQETEEMVRSVLDALAARKWDEAAEELSASGDGLRILNDLLERGASSDEDFPSLLEGYCQVRLCDAPYTVVETRGSYYPELVSPEVDVRFDYPGGSTVETFIRLQTEGGNSLRTLPGQSNLAWTVNRPSAAALLQPGEDDLPSGLLEAAEAVRQALLSEDGPAILEPFVPEEGTAFSSDSYLEPNGDLRVRVRGPELLNAGDQLRIWGYDDGVGFAIVDSIDGWIARYRRNSALLEPDRVAVNDRIGRSNTINNLSDVFPAAYVVEFHREGRGELVDFNWSSIRFAMEERPSGWVVVAITSDTWTI